MTKISLITFLSILIFTGCNTKIFMPYEEEPLCQAGKETGYCGSVSDVYEVKIKEDNRR
jgi:hypothetical protein